MKINKKNLKHWIILIKFTLVIFKSILLRQSIHQKHSNQIILYGHKFNGNLKALYLYGKSKNLNISFLTIDPDHHNFLIESGISSLLGIDFKISKKIAYSSLIISDHGLHSLVILMYLTKIKFIDVWHGVPFKGFDKDDFKIQRQYDEVWVTSKLLRQLYINKFGFHENIVKTIGYARTDKLVNQSQSIIDIKRTIGIPEKFQQRKIILFAPTWNQDCLNRNIYPFNLTEKFFLDKLHDICKATNSICLIRKHLNTSLKLTEYPKYIFDCSSAKFPDTEDILLISDILICDWSSIAFDFLLLNRPTLFLDVEPPFKKGFSLDSSYRFGPIIKNIEELCQYIKIYSIKSEIFNKEFGDKMAQIKLLLYDNLADGHVSARSIKRIHTLISS